MPDGGFTIKKSVVALLNDVGGVLAVEGEAEAATDDPLVFLAGCAIEGDDVLAALLAEDGEVVVVVADGDGAGVLAVGDELTEDGGLFGEGEGFGGVLGVEGLLGGEQEEGE